MDGLEVNERCMQLLMLHQRIKDHRVQTRARQNKVTQEEREEKKKKKKKPAPAVSRTCCTAVEHGQDAESSNAHNSH